MFDAGLRQPDRLDHASGDRDVLVGLFRIIPGISYLVDSPEVNNFTLGLFGDNMWLWGLWDLDWSDRDLGRVSLLAAASSAGYRYIWAILVIVNSFLSSASRHGSAPRYYPRDPGGLRARLDPVAIGDIAAE